MSGATITAQPRLAVVASEARQKARAEKRARNPLRKAARLLAVTFAILFATLGLGAGTAQAWPWTDMQEDIAAFVTNFCGPEDVPQPRGHEGVDNQLGLNNIQNSDKRETITPNTQGLAKEPLNGLERIQKAYDGQTDVISPTYERYGFTTLSWDNYGAGCFSTGYWFTAVANNALTYFVMFPMISAMAVLQLALGNTLYTVFAGVISPFVSIFTAIFKGWALWLAPIGMVWAFVRSQGSLRVVAKTGAWMLLIFGVFIWMGNSTSTVVTKANNFVTEFASSAATQINDINGVQTGTDGTAVSAINQSLWYGVPYQTWLEGTVGPEAAAADRDRVANGEVSWGAAILNSKYVENDNAGKDVVANSDRWNNLSYSPNEGAIDEVFDNMKTKPGAWTKNKIWEKVPYLFNVKAMCGDTSNGGGFLGKSNSGEEDNRWMYGGSCDSASAGTAGMIPYFTGTEYNARMATAISGGFAAMSVALAVGLAAIYLVVQKMLFYFLLLFGPVFLTIAMFGDEKRAAFAKRYGELMIANILKQGVAVLVVLFIANAMSMLLYPPAGEQFAALRDIPWLLKPTLALVFIVGLALFLVPLKRIVTGAVKGDTSVVDKTARMPVDAAKTAAKVGVGVGVGAAGVAAVAASGGAAAPVVAKMGGMAMSAGRMAGSRGGIGKGLTMAGRGANLAARMGGSIADSNSRKAALTNLAEGVFKQDPKAREMLQKVPGALDEQGKMTPKGQAIMASAVKNTANQGEQSSRADALQRSYAEKFYKGHLANTGEHHPMDPNSPENMRASAVEKEAERMTVQQAAKHGAHRAQNTGAPQGASAAGSSAAGAAANPTESFRRTQEASAEAARENVSGPSFAQDDYVKANVSMDGNQVAEQMGMTPREIAQNPAALLSGTAYNGGSVERMDPRHPATASMNELRFAMMAGDQQGIENASLSASEALSQHGVPAEVASVSAVQGTPEGMATAISAMPSISEDTPWKERAEAATTMQAAMSLVPDSSPAYAPMQTYVQALSSPTVDAQTVEGLRAQVIESADPEVAAAVPAADMGEAIRVSADRVSAVPAAQIAEQGAGFAAAGPDRAPSPGSSGPSFAGDGVDAPVEYPAGPAPMVDAPVLESPAEPSAEMYAPSFAGESSGYGDHDGYGAAPQESGARPAPQHRAPDVGAAQSRVEPVSSVGQPFLGGGGSDAPAASDFFGNTYHDVPSAALEAMPPVPQEMQYGEPDPTVVANYRAELEHWRQDYGVQAPVGGVPSSGGFGASMLGAAANLLRGKDRDGSSASEAPEEVSGMPTQEHEDNTLPYNPSKRPRRSGFFGGDDDDDDAVNGGE